MQTVKNTLARDGGGEGTPDAFLAVLALRVLVFWGFRINSRHVPRFRV